MKMSDLTDAIRTEVGNAVGGEELAAVTLRTRSFHGEWNYVVRPHNA